MFEGARVARLVSSPLRRAVETAQLISAAAKADLSVDDRLSIEITAPGQAEASTTC